MHGVKYYRSVRLRPRHLLRAARASATQILYGVGGQRRLCPICGRTSRRFAPYRRRREAMCVWCSSLERHRLVWSYFQQRTNLFDGSRRRILHVAPERCFEPRFRARLGRGYVTADIGDPRADVHMDVMQLAFPDATFDFVYCSHVLEHVADDRRAMREFRRVLKPGGHAVLMVPIIRSDQTFEDPAITDPRERERAFGQHDHVRAYGPDYVDRLRDAGFAVDVLDTQALATPDDVDRMVLSGRVYVCRHATA